MTLDLTPYRATAAPSEGASALYLPPARTGRAETPHKAALNVSTDLDVTVCVALDTWTPPTSWGFIAKAEAGATAPSCSWQFYVQTNGSFLLGWSPTGSATFVSATSIVPTLPIPPGAVRWLRVTLDVDNGAGGRTATFYISNDGTNWIQLSQTTTAGVTSIFASTAPLTVGGRLSNGATNLSMAGRVFSAEVRNGIGGPVVASPNFAARPAGTTAFTDAQGNAWTVVSPAAVQGLRGKASVARSAPARFRPAGPGVTWTGVRSLDPFALPAPGEFTLRYAGSIGTPRPANYNTSVIASGAQGTATQVWNFARTANPTTSPVPQWRAGSGTNTVVVTTAAIPAEGEEALAWSIKTEADGKAAIDWWQAPDDTQPDDPAVWTHLGHNVSTGTPPLPLPQDQLLIGASRWSSAAWPWNYYGDIYWAEMRAGLDPNDLSAPVLWRFDAAEWPGTLTWTDKRGRAWEVNVLTAITRGLARPAIASDVVAQRPAYATVGPTS